MTIAKSIIAVAALALMSNAALAESLTEKPKVADCNRLATEVNRALKTANETSPNYDAAQKEKQLGSHFCAVSDFRRGVDRYSHALELLGVQDQAAKPSPS